MDSDSGNYDASTVADVDYLENIVPWSEVVLIHGYLAEDLAYRELYIIGFESIRIRISQETIPAFIDNARLIQLAHRYIMDTTGDGFVSFIDDVIMVFRNILEYLDSLWELSPGK